MVNDGINNVAEVRRHTEVYVKRELFAGKSQPSTLNRRYFPNKRDYSNIIRAVRVTHMHSLVDQEELKAKIGEWKELHPHDNFFFRPYVEQEETEDHCQEDDIRSTILLLKANFLISSLHHLLNNFLECPRLPPSSGTKNKSLSTL